MRLSADTPEARAELVTRLVDGSLSEAERVEAERILATQPELAREVQRQHRVSRALATGGPEPPERLLAHVRRQVQPGRRRSALRLEWGRGRFALAGAVAAGAIAAIVVAATLGGSSHPTVTAAARLAYSPSTGPAPAMSSRRFIAMTYSGITFPNYDHRFGAVPSGQRTDRIGGRPALTVYYRLSDGTRLSYTVFSGSPVPPPAAARWVVYDGARLRTYSQSGLSVVTLVRDGRTCVLAAPSARDTVLALAAAPIRDQL